MVYVFYSEFREIFKQTYLVEYLWTVAFSYYLDIFFLVLILQYFQQNPFLNPLPFHICFTFKKKPPEVFYRNKCS